MSDWYRNPDWDADARADFEQRLSRARQSRSSYIRIKAFTLAQAGLLDEATALYERLLTEHPDDFEERRALEHLGDIARAQGRFEEAEMRYRHLRSLPPSNVRSDILHVSLAEVLLELQRPEEASTVLVQMSEDEQVMFGITAFYDSLFRYELACAKAARMLGDSEAAAAAADRALGLVDLPDQYSRHPGVGGVQTDAATISLLRGIASARLN
ncbi:tetratricopeptide repeat protein [Blastococcus sp. CT_GayMR16]|uniref:tetratricopeptide repeat protein n=1 Tax=Blastococcus sp. CT_GayMR16 TaxID=2559607 RepID=UPI001431FC45|nr:tetratricopeptide repeat protein [Blastococcus sp. CT_GayMR16]